MEYGIKIEGIPSIKWLLGSPISLKPYTKTLNTPKGFFVLIGLTNEKRLDITKIRITVSQDRNRPLITWQTMKMLELLEVICPNTVKMCWEALNARLDGSQPPEIILPTQFSTLDEWNELLDKVLAMRPNERIIDRIVSQFDCENPNHSLTEQNELRARCR